MGTGAGVNLKTSYARNSGWLFITIAWGMAVTFGVYVAGSFGSQGHLNPAVTIPFAIFGFFPWDQVLPYLLGQFLGAFVGAVLVIIQYGAQFKNAKDSNDGNVVGIFATGPAINNGLYNFLSENNRNFCIHPNIIKLRRLYKRIEAIDCWFTNHGSWSSFRWNNRICLESSS